jgi:hypothetical protein
MKQRNTRAFNTAPLLSKSMAAPRGRRHVRSSVTWPPSAACLCAFTQTALILCTSLPPGFPATSSAAQPSVCCIPMAFFCRQHSRNRIGGCCCHLCHAFKRAHPHHLDAIHCAGGTVLVQLGFMNFISQPTTTTNLAVREVVNISTSSDCFRLVFVSLSLYI